MRVQPNMKRKILENKCTLQQNYKITVLSIFSNCGKDLHFFADSESSKWVLAPWYTTDFSQTQLSRLEVQRLYCFIIMADSLCKLGKFWRYKSLQTNLHNRRFMSQARRTRRFERSARRTRRSRRLLYFSPPLVSRFAQNAAFASLGS